WATRGLRGERVKRVAYGYTLLVNGRPDRASGYATEGEALEALAAPARAGRTLRGDGMTSEASDSYKDTSDVDLVRLVAAGQVDAGKFSIGMMRRLKDAIVAQERSSSVEDGTGLGHSKDVLRAWPGPVKAAWSAPHSILADRRATSADLVA